MRCSVYCLLFLALIAAPVDECNAADWGTVRGQLKFTESANGDSPAAVVIAATRKQRMPIHPQLEREKQRAVEITISDGKISPTITIAQAGDVIVISNSDAHGYNLSFDLLENSPRNLLLPAGKRKRVRVAHAEPAPVLLSCNVQPGTTGLLVILDHPYAVIPDKDGNFRIANAPTGEFELRIVHPYGLTKQKITVTSETLNLGTLEVTTKKPGRTTE